MRFRVMDMDGTREPPEFSKSKPRPHHACAPRSTERENDLTELPGTWGLIKSAGRSEQAGKWLVRISVARWSSNERIPGAKP